MGGENAIDHGLEHAVIIAGSNVHIFSHAAYHSPNTFSFIHKFTRVLHKDRNSFNFILQFSNHIVFQWFLSQRTSPTWKPLSPKFN